MTLPSLPRETRDLKVALFSGNYNYVRDGANQALNRLMGYLIDRGAEVRVYAPMVANPAFEGVGEGGRWRSRPSRTAARRGHGGPQTAPRRRSSSPASSSASAASSAPTPSGTGRRS